MTPMNETQLNIAIVQMDVMIGEPTANYKRAEQLLEQAVTAAKIKPDIIVLPEMWNTGYALERIQDLADVVGSRTKQFFATFCRKHEVAIVGGSVAQKVGGRIFNTIFVFNSRGELIADYSKIHLFRLMDEEKHLSSGEQLGRFQLDSVEAGMIICYDLRFPELTRSLAVGGAKLLFVPAQWPNPRLKHWRTLLQARAIENQMFVVACNRVGVSGESSFFGHSMVIDPWGEIVSEAGEDEVILRVTIDLTTVDRVRRGIPVFEDRKSGIYRL